MMIPQMYMIRRCNKKIPYKEVNGYYRLSYGNVTPLDAKDWFDPDEDNED